MSAEVIEPKAYLTLANNPDATISGFRLITAIDTVPTAVIMPHRNISAVERSVFIAGSAVVAYLSKFQALKFKPLAQMDATIEAEDGRGGIITFDGFTNVPSVRLQSDFYNLTLQLQHGISRLAILDTGAYRSPFRTGR